MMKRFLSFTVMMLLFISGVYAGEEETHCKFKPHFQANLEIKGIGTGHMLQGGDFSILRPYGLGFDFDMPAGGPGLDVIVGCRIRKYAFIGGGLSVNFWFNEKSDQIGTYHTLPLPASSSFSRYGTAWAFYVAPRFYIPLKTTDEIEPYVDLGIGFCQFFLIMKEYAEHQYVMDFYSHIGLGVDINHFNISAGYQYSYSSNGYLRIGYRF